MGTLWRLLLVQLQEEEGIEMEVGAFYLMVMVR